jgi:hypothetical protein
MSQPKPFRSRKLRLNAESLESRALLTGGAGSTFALIPGDITTAGGQQTVTVHVDTTHFTVPKHTMSLGIDIAPMTNSTVSGKVAAMTSSSVTTEGGATVHTQGHRAANVHLSRVRNNQAVLANVRLKPGQSGIDQNVTITAQNNTSGQYILGFYLPGDANGDGTVDKTDLSTIDKAIGAISGDAQYSLDTDTNRDGRIGMNDLMLAKRNFGVKTTITPVINANLDPASDTGASDRITNEQVVHFSGTGTPGAAITYAEINSRTPAVSTTADANGNYSLNIPLALGTNTFKLTSVDAFDQTISGTISPVTYQTDPVPAAAPSTTTPKS